MSLTPTPVPERLPAPFPLPAWSAVATLQQVGSVARWVSVAGLLVWGTASPNVPLWWALLPLCLMPVVVGAQTVLAHVVNRRAGLAAGVGSGCAVTVAGSWQAWLREVPASESVFGWRQPWAWRTQPNVTPPQGTSQRGVLLVHGYLCNRGLWNRWLPVLQQHGHATVALNLEPVLGSIDDYAQAIDEAVQHLTRATGLAPLVVCHSMGGLAVRAWMRAFPGADARVHHVVTIGTPHHGTWLAQWGQGANGQQMRCHSPWLVALAQAEPPLRYQKFSCWHSDGDNIVFPMGTALLPGASAHCLPHVGHVALVDEPAIQAHVLRLLQPSA